MIHSINSENLENTIILKFNNFKINLSFKKLVVNLEILKIRRSIPKL